MSNKIKSLNIYRVDHLPDAEVPDAEQYGIIHSTEEFDQEGKLVLEIAYTMDGEIGDKSEFRYDEAGRLAESKIYGEDGEVLERNEIFRDNDGRILKELVHYLDGSIDTRTYEYDEKGRLTGMEAIDDEDEKESSEKYYYEDDSLIKVERYNEEDELVFYQEDSYENGALMQRKVWSSETEEPFTLVTEFNGNGRRERETRYDSNNRLIERNAYEEDERGRVIKVVEENRQRKNTTEISFDEKNNIIYQKETDLNGDLNHEIFRSYEDDGKPSMVTVVAVQKSSGTKRAYSLVYIYEIHS